MITVVSYAVVHVKYIRIFEMKQGSLRKILVVIKLEVFPFK